MCLRKTTRYSRLSTTYFIFFINWFILFIYFWLPWVFVAARGPPLDALGGVYSWLRCAGLSLRWPLLLRSTGSRCTGFRSCGTWASVVAARGLQSAGSAAVAHGPSCSVACGIFPDQGSNPCPLHWQADSQPLRHQGSPLQPILKGSQPHIQGTRQWEESI